MARISTLLSGLACAAMVGLLGGCAHHGSQPEGPPPPAPTGAAYGTGPAPLLSPEATHEEIARWLADYAPSSRGREVFISGTEAFWFEHQDRDAKSPMHVVATIHSENFADRDTEIRSAYEVTDFDCEKQTQKHIYLRRYLGPDQTGDVRKETVILNLASFVQPTDQDYAHLRTLCLPVYDELRKRTYSITVPGR